MRIALFVDYGLEGARYRAGALVAPPEPVFLSPEAAATEPQPNREREGEDG